MQGEVRGLEDLLRIVFDFVRNGDHRIDKQVELALAFGSVGSIISAP